LVWLAVKQRAFRLDMAPFYGGSEIIAFVHPRLPLES